MRYGILFLGLLLASASQADGVAHYQDKRFGYVAGNLMNITLDYDSRELTPTGVGVRLGGMIDPHWGVELRAAVAPSGDTWRAENSRNKVDYTVDHIGALLATEAKSFARSYLSRYDDCLRVGFVPVRAGTGCSSPSR